MDRQKSDNLCRFEKCDEETMWLELWSLLSHENTGYFDKRNFLHHLWEIKIYRLQLPTIEN